MTTHVLALPEVKGDHWLARVARAACLRARRRQMRTVDVCPERRLSQEEGFAAMSWAAYRVAQRV